MELPLHLQPKVNMSRRRTLITDLNFDVLAHIMVFVAKSANGAANLARATTVCKLFRQISEDALVLKSLSFDNLDVLNRHGLFQDYNGLLTRSALVGNSSAESMLAMLIIVSVSRLMIEQRGLLSYPMAKQYAAVTTKHISELCTFLSHFAPNKASTSKMPRAISHHLLLKMFLSRCSTHEFGKICPYIVDYFEYFVSIFGQKAYHFASCLCGAYNTLLDMEEMKLFIFSFTKRRFLWLQEELLTFPTFVEEYNRYRLICREVETKCRRKGLDYRLIFQNEFKEFDQAYKEALAGFNKFRICLISFMEDLPS